MGKWGRYEKNYNEEWEKEDWAKDWLTKSSEADINNGKGQAYCKLCKVNLRAQKADLNKHKGTNIHIAREKVLPKNLRQQMQPTLGNFGFSQANANQKAIDIKLAVHIACHSAVKSIDHLGLLLKSLGKGSKLENLQLHRTKCSKLIVHVVPPSLLKTLVEDVGNSPYSIIIDESTDVSVHKYMAFCIRYFSHSLREMITDFLGLVEVPRTSAEDLYTAFTSFLDCIKLPIAQLVGIGTDGASNLCGVNHSLYTLLRDRHVPQLILLKCMCHSIDICASKACDKLPSSLKFLIRESRNWFSHSALRKQQYKKLYQTLNCGEDPPCLVQLANTRWLSWYGAVNTTLNQWDTLKPF